MRSFGAVDGKTGGDRVNPIGTRFALGLSLLLAGTVVGNNLWVVDMFAVREVGLKSVRCATSTAFRPRTWSTPSPSA